MDILYCVSSGITLQFQKHFRSPVLLLVIDRPASSIGKTSELKFKWLELINMEWTGYNTRPSDVTIMRNLGERWWDS